ncbi:MAG: helix-turn-helix domain-containing protein [Prevotellaceae bacterium]|nr:helix-turn-helix domain-containing protein [Candidatus Colivivens equi]
MLLPRKVAANLKLTGEQIKLARLRRDISIAQMAERASCSALTIMRIEKGAPSVAMGIYLRVLYALGLDEDILLLAQKDELGRNLQDIDMVQHKRASKKS